MYHVYGSHSELYEKTYNIKHLWVEDDLLNDFMKSEENQTQNIHIKNPYWKKIVSTWREIQFEKSFD